MRDRDNGIDRWQNMCGDERGVGKYYSSTFHDDGSCVRSKEVSIYGDCNQGQGLDQSVTSRESNHSHDLEEENKIHMEVCVPPQRGPTNTCIGNHQKRHRKIIDVGRTQENRARTLKHRSEHIIRISEKQEDTRRPAGATRN